MGKSLTRSDLEKVRWDGRAPRLKKLAEFINENLPGYKAEMERWWGSFDRPCGRLRIPGKDRECMELVVHKVGEFRAVLRHNPIEAYRNNNEVVRWILNILDEMKVENEKQSLVVK